MPRRSNYRQNKKEAAIKQWKAKKEELAIDIPAYENQNMEELNEVVVRKRLKPGRKKRNEAGIILTRQQQRSLKLIEEQIDILRQQSQNARDKIAEIRKNAKETGKKRREVINETNYKIKLRKQEEIIDGQHEIINNLKGQIECVHSALDSEPSTSPLPPLSINIENSMPSISAPVSPSEHNGFELPRPQSAPPKLLNSETSARIRNRIGLSDGKYDVFRAELSAEGISMPSLSTIRRKESRIFNEHFQYSDKPDFYGLIEKAVLKYDFSQLKEVRITVGGDGGGDGDKSSVKVGCYFNDIPLPLSVKKFMIIWSYVGKESWDMLKTILPYIDADILRLKQNGIKTKVGVKPVIITFVGDCKFICLSLSLQGGYSVCGCPKCLTKRSQWPTINSENIILRTTESIIEHAENVLNENGRNQMNGSVFNLPLIRNIPISHFVPPPVHLLMSLVKRIIEYIYKTKGEDYLPLKNFLKNSGARRDERTKSYNGNGCRKILSHFREENQKRIIYGDYGSDLFVTASNIERYAVARPLNDDEMKALEANINLFFNLVKEEYGPDASKFFLNKTLIHMLKEHVVPFVKVFKSWGLFSEESVESIHRVRNVLDNRVPGVGPEIDAKRSNFFYKNHALGLHFI